MYSIIQRPKTIRYVIKKFRLEIPYGYRDIVNKMKSFHSVMTSMTMLLAFVKVTKSWSAHITECD